MTDRLPRWTVQLEEEVAGKLAAAPPPFIGDGSKPVWSIDTPPPYPSGKWHIGAVAGYSLIDVIARSKRMAGYDVLFPWGVDRNGINIEFAIEKKHKKRMLNWIQEMGEVDGRAAFNQACEEAIAEFSNDMVRIGQRIGLSCDFAGGYATDSSEYRAFSQAQFLQLFEQGQIVEDLRPNSYDPKLGTAIADAEVFYEERKTNLNHIEWTIKETGEKITISTTRPELICACRQVLVHPDNEETAHLVGKTAVLPLQRGDDLPQEVPIGTHTHVKTDFGSGIMMVCSYGDQADVQLFRELELEAIAAIGMDGRMTSAAGQYEGLKVEEARKTILVDLEEAGKLLGADKIDQKFPVSERSKSAVEIISLKEWYVKQTHCTDELRAIANDTKFTPPKHRQLLLDWIDTVTIDWPISRRRFYHTEIPLWFVVDGDEESDLVIVPPYDAAAADHTYHRPWAQQPPAGSTVVHRNTRELLGSWEDWQKANPGHTAKGESKVFDTWMDSSVSNLYILKNYRNTDWGQEHICSIRPQGRDIVRTWLYYTLLKSHLLLDKPAFENAWIHGMGMDKNGRKMSKSLGNVVDPDKILGQIGSDAFRLWITGECTIGDDFRINEEKVRGASKFLQKLGNVASFVNQFEAPAERPANLDAADEWILGELDAVVARTVSGYEALDFFTPANDVRNFVWNLFAPHYLEMAKARAYEGDASACWTLQHCVEVVLRLLAPICPLFCSFVYEHLNGQNVHALGFPEALGQTQNTDLTEAVIEFNSTMWRQKKEAGLSLAEEVDAPDIPEPLVPMQATLASMHRFKSS